MKTLRVKVKMDWYEGLRTRMGFLLFVALVSSFFAYAYRDLLGYGLLSFGDLTPFPEPGEAFNAFFFSWQPLGMGFSLPREAHLFFMGILTTLLGSDVVLSQKLFYLSLLPVASISMYVFLNSFITSRISKFVASLFYIATIEPLWSFVNGASTFLFLQAIYPLLLFFFFNLLNGEKRISNMLIFTIFLGVAVSFHYQFILFFAPFMAIFLIIHILERRNHEYTIKTIVLLSFSLLLCYLLGSPWWAPFGIQSLLFPWSEMAKTLPMEKLILDVSHSYRYATLTNLLTLNVIHPASLLLPLFAFASILFSGSGRKRRYAIGFSILVFSVTLFGWLTHLGITLDVFSTFPFLFAFREAAKLIYVLLPAYPPLIAITIDGILDRFRFAIEKPNVRLRGARLALPLAALSSIILLLVFNIGIYEGGRFLRGDMALHEYRGSAFVVPDAVQSASDWIKERRENEGFFRTLWLPLDFHTQNSLTWMDPYTFGVPAQGEVLGLPNLDYVKFVLSVLSAGLTSHIGTLLALSNVKYIIVNLASDQRGPPTVVNLQRTYYPTGDPNRFVEILDKQADLKLIENRTEFLVYENMRFVTHLAAYDDLFFIMEPAPIDYSSTTYHATENLISNPGFESGLDHWSLIGKGGFSIDTIAHTGRSSVKIANLFQEDAEVRQSLPVYGDAQYEVSFFMRVVNVKSSLLKLVWYDSWEPSGKPVREDVLEQVHESKNWWQSKHLVTSPRDAVRLDVVCSGGRSLDGANPGLTWFDDISIVGFYSPLPAPTSGLAAMLALSHVPNFDPTKHLVVFEEGLHADSTVSLKNSSRALIFLNGSPQESDEVTASHDYLIMLEAEAAFIPKHGYWSHPKEIRASNGYVIKCEEEGIALGNFSIPRSGQYRIAVRTSTEGGIVLSIDDESALTINSTGDESLMWFESKPVYLKDDEEHTVSLLCQGPSVIDQLIIFSAEDDEKLEDIFNSGEIPPQPSSSRINPTKYQVEFSTSGPAFLIMGESYHPDWNAYADHTKLGHFKTFYWSNGFRVGTSGLITVSFDLQKLRNQTITIWAATWIFILVAAVYTSLRPLVRYKVFRKIIR